MLRRLLIPFIWPAKLSRFPLVIIILSLLLISIAVVTIVYKSEKGSNWPDTFEPYTYESGARILEKNEDQDVAFQPANLVNLNGNSNAVYYALADDSLFFRMRLADNPVDPKSGSLVPGFHPTVRILQDGQYLAAVGADSGKNGISYLFVRSMKNNDTFEILASYNEEKKTTPYTRVLIDRDVEQNSYLFDFEIPLAVLERVTGSDLHKANLQFLFGTRKSAEPTQLDLDRVVPFQYKEQLLSVQLERSSFLQSIATFFQGLINNRLTAIFTVIILLMMAVTVILYHAIAGRVDELKREVTANRKMVAASIRRQFKETFGRERANNQTIIEWYFSNLTISLTPHRRHNLTKIMKWIESTPSMYIILGVLGTFIGLVQSLTQLGGFTESAIAGVMTGMNVAFNTSIIGIVCALLTTVILKLYNVEHVLLEMMYTLENELESGELETTDSKEKLALMEQKEHRRKVEEFQHRALVAFGNMTEQLTTMAGSLSKFEGVSDSLTTFNENFKKTTRAFDKTIENMSKISDALGGNIERFNDTFEKLIEQLKHSQASYERIAELFNACVEQFETIIENSLSTQESLQESFDTQLETMRALREAFDQSMTKIHAEIEKVANSVDQSVNKLNDFDERLNGHISEAVTIAGQLAKQLDDSLKAVAGLLDQNTLETIKGMTDKFAVGVEQLGGLQTTWLTNLGEFNTNVNESTKQYQELIRGLTNVTEQASKQIEVIEKSEDWLAGMLSAMSALDTSLSKVNDALHKSETFFDQHSRESISSLRDFIQTISKTIKAEFETMDKKTTALAREKMFETTTLQQLNVSLKDLVSRLEALAVVPKDGDET